MVWIREFVCRTFDEGGGYYGEIIVGKGIRNSGKKEEKEEKKSPFKNYLQELRLQYM